MSETKSIFDACMKQIMKTGDRVNIHVRIDTDIEFEFIRKNGNFGTHKLPYDEFIKYIHHLDTEAALSDLVGMAYNNLLEKEGSSHRLGV